MFHTTLNELYIFYTTHYYILQGGFQRRSRRRYRGTCYHDGPYSTLFPFAFPNGVFRKVSRQGTPYLFRSIPSYASDVNTVPDSYYECTTVQLYSTSIRTTKEVADAFSTQAIYSIQIDIVSDFAFMPGHHSRSTRESTSDHSYIPYGDSISML